MAPVDALKNSKISDMAGFVEVDADTCQHVKYPNVFSLGDSSNLAVSKTAAAVGSQSEVVRQNLTSLVNGKNLTAKVTISHIVVSYINEYGWLQIIQTGLLIFQIHGFLAWMASPTTRYQQ